MPNAIALPFPERASNPAPAFTLAVAGEPTADEGIELQVGEAVRDAVVVVAQAMLSYRQTGLLDPAVKDAGGSRLGALVELQMAMTGEVDFVAMAYRAGRAQLRRYFDEELYRRCSPEQVDEAIDIFIADVLNITAKVIKFERSFDC
jgi:hypothetical protein